jgi:molecular chaperone DnaK (HSP70)
MKIAVDFGTTNTVIAVWRDALQAPETIRLPGLSHTASADQPPLVPSLLYVLDGGPGGEVLAGGAVRAGGYDIGGDERYFASFKRSIAASTHSLPRTIDGAAWDDKRAGEAFLNAVLSAVVEKEGPVEELILTVPVQSFERYLKWMRDEVTLGVGGESIRQLRIVDESTSAALGYEVRTPGELLLVVDFGGGTLDVSLVRMPVAEGEGGVVLDVSGGRAGGGSPASTGIEARVIAKAGRVLGGDDVDHWLLDELLARNDAARPDVGGAYSALKGACEAAKIRLSAHESAAISVFDPDTARTYRATFTRSQLEDLLDRHEFYSAVQRTINKTLRAARTRGIFPEDIGAVLLVGGTSQIPSVQRLVRGQFDAERVFDDRPFEAVSHGALNLAVGMGVDDFLYHSYGVRHLSPITGRHEWEEIIAAGSRYPLEQPITLILTASRDGQEALELVIGEVEESAGGVAEVMFGERAILMVDGAVELRQVVALNDEDGSRTVAYLDPPGRAGEDRVEVVFDVDRNRTLRVSVTDLLTGEELLHEVPVVELR